MATAPVLRSVRAALRRWIGERSGAAAIEFGFALPVLMLLSIGLIDFSRFVWYSATLTNAASEGTRYAVVHGAASSQTASAAEIADYVRQQAVGIPAADLQVSVNWAPNNQSGGVVRVTLDHRYDFLIGPMIGLPSIDLRRSSEMVMF